MLTVSRRRGYSSSTGVHNLGHAPPYQPPSAGPWDQIHLSLLNLPMWPHVNGSLVIRREREDDGAMRAGRAGRGKEGQGGAVSVELSGMVCSVNH